MGVGLPVAQKMDRMDSGFQGAIKTLEFHFAKADTILQVSPFSDSR